MPGRSEPVLLGDPGSAEQLAQVSGLIRLAVATTGVLGLVVTAIVVLAAAKSRPAGYHSSAIAAISFAVVLAAALGRHWPGVFAPRVLAYVLPVTVPALAVGAWLVGPQFGSLVTMFFVWYGTSITFLPRRAALSLLVWVAVVDAGLLALQRGNHEPLIRWEGAIAIMGFVAVVTSRLVERAWTLARGEQAARQQAERARAEFELVSAEKTRFLARMSHELRTPLNAIIGFSDVLARRSFGELNAKQAEYIDDVVDSGRHLLDLVDDLLDLAKVEAGTVELSVAQVEVAGLLASSLNLFKEQAGRRQIRLRLDAPAEVGAVEADARKLKQVLFNLLANALRFTPPGGQVTLAARRSGDRVRLSVSDTGPGIAADEQEAIFEEFRQAGGTGEAKGGTGLGLPMARRLVALHGGRLWVESELDTGSTFVAELPVHPREHRRGDDPPPKASDPPVRLILGEPDSPQRREENARLLTILGWFCLPLIATIFPIFHFHPPPVGLHYDEWLFAVTGVISLGLVLALLLWPQVMGAPGVLPYVAGFGIVVTSVGFYGLGSTFGDPGWAYLIAVVGVFVTLSPRQLVGEMVLIGVCYGVVLALRDGWNLPVARWVAAMTLVAVTAVILRRFVARIDALARAEREAGREAEEAGASLAAADRHKSEFLANMSHELRTPLNVIIGFSEVLEGQVFGPLNEKQAEYVGDVLASGRHLLALINDILELAKIDAGRMDLWLTEFDVDAALSDARQTFAAEAARRGIELAVETETASASLEADSAKLGRAVNHLISNALRFTPEGGRVTLRATQDTGHVEISVTDTGPGIAAGNHERIFDAFALGDAQTDQGTGLGLTLARRYAELHHGSLDVTSAAGVGATFTLRLPLRPETASAEVPA